MRLIFLSLLYGVSVVRSAINPDGTQAVEPVTDDDASPIADMATYYPDLHDCPLECDDLTNTNGWITYFSMERLKRCNETMLLQFSITQLLDKSDSTILIRTCSLRSSNSIDATVRPELLTVENPKKDEKLYLPSLESAPACTAEGIKTKDLVHIVTGNGRSNSTSSSTSDIDGILDGIGKHFAAKDNCDELFVFAYH
ncbi:chitinase [Ascochyta rabiei]|uniref:Chitinase n=1 Tax=Didymella rabiei TaxID=5454 RepID=A0A163AS50_DIDRA|nr:chitinase [Ascochyta rabiei]